MLINKIKPLAALLLCALLICLAAFPAAAAEYPIPVGEQTVTLPLKGLAPGARSTNCWEFAQTVYQAVWGVRFSGFRGDGDDMLREISTGSARAITVENTKNFISAAPLGATVRIADTVYGDDNQGRYKHSFILIGKDDEGFTVYEGSVNGRVRIKYYTWSAFANGYFGRHYRYYKYIKWPGASTYAQLLAAHATLTTVPEEAELLSPEALPKFMKEAPVIVLAENASSDYGAYGDYLPGDVDNDGLITAADARLILRQVVQIDFYEPDSAAYAACDVDGDGFVTSEDARMLMRISVGIEDFE